MTTNTDNKSVVRTVNAETEKAILAAFATLFPLVSQTGEKPLPESFADCSTEDLGTRAVKAYNAIKNTRAARAEQAVKAVRVNIAKVVDAALATHKKAHTEYMSLSATVRGLVSFPNVVLVPLSDIAPLFGEGASQSAIVAKVKELDYKVVDVATSKPVDGRTKGNPTLALSIPAPFTAAAKAA